MEDVEKIAEQILEEKRDEILQKLDDDARKMRENFDMQALNDFIEIFTSAIDEYVQKHNLKLSVFDRDRLDIVLAAKAIALRAQLRASR